MQYRPLGVLTFLIDNTLLEKKTFLKKKLFFQFNMGSSRTTSFCSDNQGGDQVGFCFHR